MVLILIYVESLCIILIMTSVTSVWYWSWFSKSAYGADHLLCLFGTDHDVCGSLCMVLIKMSVWYWSCSCLSGTGQDVCMVLIMCCCLFCTDQDVWYWSRCLCGIDQDICYTCVVLTIMFVHDSTGSLHLKPCLDCTLALNASSSTTVDVCQGCLLSLILFNLFLEKITQETLHDHHVSTPVMEGPYTTYNMLTISISWAAAMVNFKVS